MGLNKHLYLSSLLLSIPLSFVSTSFAAQQVDLSHQKPAILKSYISQATGLGFNEVSRHLDLNSMLHVRIKQTFQGHPVFGGDAILHIPHGNKTGPSLTQAIEDAANSGSMNGDVYLAIEKDVAGTPAFALNQTQAQKAIKQAIQNHQDKTGSKGLVSNSKSSLLIYIDDKQKAHWAYQVNFDVAPSKLGQLPAKPVYILDAVSLETYLNWDNIQTREVNAVEYGGGFGGNPKTGPFASMGKKVYDGLSGNMRRLRVTRDDATKTCSMKNKVVTVKHYSGGSVPTFPCPTVDPQHNNVYWNGEFHKVNSGYSPDNDALIDGKIISDMYQKWYGVPVLIENGKPKMLTMVVHAYMDNAYWDGEKMTFGDGISMFYPLTSLGVGAHEIGHGFTQQHSNLIYSGQSGGMNEAFSDMAAQGAEVFMYGVGKNSWQIGPEIFKDQDEALRYMDKPSKDCNGGKPGNWCSIDDASQYFNGLDVHFSSGVYNRAYYTLGTTKGWDGKKAFDVMVKANMDYWTPNSTFVQGACGALKAAKDLGYSVEDVAAAFATVKVDTSSC